RGVRIELGEIEAALDSHPAVAEAVVALRPELPGGGGLAAYVVAREGQAGAAAGPRAHLPARVPPATGPPALAALAAPPLRPSGKADRRALPAPGRGDWEGRAGGGRTAPRDVVEEIVAGVFAEVLGTGPLAVEDDFFALGGHSLLATQVLARLQ